AEVAAGGVRVNMIPKDGGNTFKGGGFFGGTAHGWQSDNNDDALRARGFLYRNFVQHVQDFNFNMGGPIVRDKLWFFGTAPHVSGDAEGEAQRVHGTDLEAQRSRAGAERRPGDGVRYSRLEACPLLRRTDQVHVDADQQNSV